jgi:glucose uptake protein
MLGFVFAIITVLCWGLWLAPIQNVPLRNQNIKTFYIGVVFVVITFIVTLFQGSIHYNLRSFGLPFLGGVMWGVSALGAFTGTDKLGLAKAFGIWAPMNILVSIFWGAVIFGELSNLSVGHIFLMIGCVIGVIIGVLMIIFAKGAGTSTKDIRTRNMGLFGAVSAGILWGSYIIPMKLSGVSSWVSSFPFAVGILVVSIILLVVQHQSVRLEKIGDYFRICFAGALWGMGNYTMLLMVNVLGAGRGFTIAQLGVVVNALVGVYVLKDPKPNTRAAWLTLAGCFIALAAAIMLANIK